MASPEELLEMYRFSGVTLTSVLPENTVLALITCPHGSEAIEIARTPPHTHEWIGCKGCRVEVFLEDALSMSVVKVAGSPGCTTSSTAQILLKRQRKK